MCRYDDELQAKPFFFAATTIVLQAEPITSAPPCSDSQIHTLKSRITAHVRPFPGKTLQRFPNSPPEIKNHCARETVSRQNPTAIPKLNPSNQESLHTGGRFLAKTCSDSQVCARNQESLRTGGRFQAKPCSDSQIDPLKSRITAVSRSFPRNLCSDSQIAPMKSRITAHVRPFLGKTLQRFPNSHPEIKNHCTREAVSWTKPAAIPKSGPEIKNHCAREAVSRQNPAAIPKLTP